RHRKTDAPGGAADGAHEAEEAGEGNDEGAEAEDREELRGDEGARAAHEVVAVGGVGDEGEQEEGGGCEEGDREQLLAFALGCGAVVRAAPCAFHSRLGRSLADAPVGRGLDALGGEAARSSALHPDLLRACGDGAPAGRAVAPRFRAARAPCRRPGSTGPRKDQPFLGHPGVDRRRPARGRGPDANAQPVEPISIRESMGAAIWRMASMPWSICPQSLLAAWFTCFGSLSACCMGCTDCSALRMLVDASVNCWRSSSLVAMGRRRLRWVCAWLSDSRMFLTKNSPCCRS